MIPNPISKFCVGCNQEVDADQFYKSSKGYLLKYCKSCANARGGRRTSALKAQGLCVCCGQNPRQESNSKCVECWERERARTKAWRSSIMLDVINLYGGKCNCCGETTFEFLNIDHVNNDGYLERREDGHHGGYGFYIKLLRLGHVRDDLQVLCYNCNNGKVRNNGVCPHARLQNQPSVTQDNGQLIFDFTKNEEISHEAHAA